MGHHGKALVGAGSILYRIERPAHTGGSFIFSIRDAMDVRISGRGHQGLAADSGMEQSNACTPEREEGYGASANPWS